MNPAAVPNDIEIGGDYRCLILSGANTGGKTVLLKTIGLCALMAAHGLHVPASPDSCIGAFSSVLADIGDDQSLAQSLSTFSGQLAVIRDMLLRADGSSLVIIDEIIVGTDPRQGAALARAVLEELIERQCCIVVTTHYNELKELASRDARFRNGSVSFNPETLTPDYLLHCGIPGISYALEIAKICGLPDSLIVRARTLLDENVMDAEALIERVQRLEESARMERESLAGARSEIDREKAELRKQREKMAERERELSIREGVSFLEELKGHRKTILDRIKSLEGADIRGAWSAYEALRGAEQAVGDAVRNKEDERSRERREQATLDSLSVGDRVFVPSLGKEGEVASIQKDDGTATVHLGGSFTSRHRVEELLKQPGGPRKKSPGKKKPAPENAVQHGKSPAPLTIQTAYNTIDLRGMRVHDALEKMDAELDRMMRTGIESAVVIHGHGTGAMKEAVRQGLGSSVYAADWRPGEIGEGGDGVTIVLLRLDF
jgi:DNA mismatch repair protein MutS2